jgi:hypothetical protein
MLGSGKFQVIFQNFGIQITLAGKSLLISDSLLRISSRSLPKNVSMT